MSDQETNEIVDPFKPYKGRFESFSAIPQKGRSKDKIFEELSSMAGEEDAKWKTGKVSGTFYHAGEAHREYLNKVFTLFSHVNTLQFDLCQNKGGNTGRYSRHLWYCRQLGRQPGGHRNGVWDIRSPLLHIIFT